MRVFRWWSFYRKDAITTHVVYDENTSRISYINASKYKDASPGLYYEGIEDIMMSVNVNLLKEIKCTKLELILLGYDK